MCQYSNQLIIMYSKKRQGLLGISREVINVFSFIEYLIYNFMLSNSTEWSHGSFSKEIQARLFAGSL